MSDGRCPTCGGRTVWPRDRIIKAAQEFAALNGDEPPAAADWRASTWQHPSDSIVRKVFGTWNAMIAAAGFQPRRPGAPRAKWSREQVAYLITVWRFEHGELPSYKDWCRAAPGRPTSSQLQRMYGSFNAAIVHAGYEPFNRRRSDVSYRGEARNALKAVA